ncbi:MAG: hypothetical protein WCD11_06220 [Solirubrobacteraceae bacterium]
MASKPLSVFKEPGRRRHRQPPTFFGMASFILVVLALVGLVAVVLLVLGLLNVHWVTQHFSVR